VQRNRPPSAQTITVVRALAADPTAWRHGYDLCQQTGLKAGTLYPILIRLADRSWLETTWENENPGGRPVRHLYRLTKTGVKQVKELAADGPAAARSRKIRGIRLRPRPEGA
jgi:DNA-binding PadR family transcriptional regulator